MNDFFRALGEVLNGVAQAQAPQQGASPMPAAAAPKSPRSMAPLALPQIGPMPQPRPQLPGGTFTPNRQDRNAPQPQPAPQPAPNPAPSPGMMVQGPLGQLFGGRSPSELIRSIGAGMATIDPHNDDPLSTFGRAVSGVSQYRDNQSSSAAQAEQTNLENARKAADAEIKSAAEKRAAEKHDLDMKKTRLELERTARQRGLDLNTVLRIESIAQEAGKEIPLLEDRRRVVEAERERLYRLAEASQGISTGQGISGKGGLSAPQPGHVEDGYTFQGGNPSDPNSWIKN
ncbi:hypothetical protein [Pseudohoeflea coraliihabitans]|uniref:Uncharacterized protein n=1 Tax=Pseudohoeflea coraliihabitans TaxID=2860393 RepID=A0ABS6WVR6_9HYPH|nr:hypothetical protein [Pseudohoeflea sp. DP4N28-3]MBW3099195.1 hypothetical protein [Pseudohoeflea sp. DP4N28-3]